MKHVVHFSGGLCSFWAAYRVIQQHGTSNVVLLFCDTKWEDASLYLFNQAASGFLGVPLTVLCDGRNPWEVFRDHGMIGSGRVDMCSRELKRDLLDRWRKENARPGDVFYLGLDWTEEHRLVGTAKKPGGMKAIFAPYEVRAPMMEEPLWDKCRMERELLSRTRIDLPRLYRLRFPHNNCGGFCVKAGQAHFAHLYRTLPDVYAKNEYEEEKMRTVVGDYSVMKDRRGGGPRRTLTMRQLRERIDAGEEFDRADWGGCGCSVELAYDPRDDV